MKSKNKVMNVDWVFVDGDGAGDGGYEQNKRKSHVSISYQWSRSSSELRIVSERDASWDWLRRGGAWGRLMDAAATRRRISLIVSGTSGSSVLVAITGLI